MKCLFRLILTTFLVFPLVLTVGPRAQAAEGSLSWTVSGHDVFARANGQSAAGLGSYLFGDIQVTPWMSWGLGLGYTKYFIHPGNASVGLLDVGGRLFPFKGSPKGRFYLQGGVGLMLSNKGIDHDGAKVHGTAGVGYRLKLQGNMALDFGLDYNAFSPRLAPTQDAALHVGVAWAFGPQGTPAPKKAQTPRRPPAPAKTGARPSTPVPADSEHEQVTRTRKSLYERGVEAYNAKDYALATKYFKQAIEVPGPKNTYYAESCALVGAIYHYRGMEPGHLEIARQYYLAALAVDPRVTVASKGLAVLNNTLPPQAGALPRPSPTRGSGAPAQAAVHPRPPAQKAVHKPARKALKKPAPTPTADPNTATYTWSRGDNLHSLANAYYGDQDLYPIIVDANKGMLVLPANLVPGAHLKVPRDPTAAEKQAAKENAAKAEYVKWLNAGNK